MPPPIPLTTEEKKYIDDNWKRISFKKISKDLKLKSPYKIYAYCRENGYKKLTSKPSEKQRKIILENAFKMTENQICELTGVSKFYVQKSKREAGIARYGKNIQKKHSVAEEYFNVNQMEWI